MLRGEEYFKQKEKAYVIFFGYRIHLLLLKYMVGEKETRDEAVKVSRADLCE